MDDIKAEPQADGDPALNDMIIGEGTTTLDMLVQNYPWLNNCLLPEHRRTNVSEVPTLYIMRGLPGSGKSTKAKELADKLMAADYSRCTWVVSADDYWIRPDQSYDWNPRKLKDAHTWCFKQAMEWMSQSDGKPHIILDNTSIKKADYAPYLDLAEQHSYKVEEVVIGQFDEESCKVYAERCVHGCPLETILRRAKDFEP